MENKPYKEVTMDTMIEILAKELDRPVQQVQNVADLLDQGNTIPFIARYRKEQHGAMDDALLRKLADRLDYLRGLAARREEVKKAIDNQGKLTDALVKAIDNASTLAEVEDLYRPYKQKRRTRATIAREKGLEPLATVIFAQMPGTAAPEKLAKPYVNGDTVATVEDALRGASDIIAEQISDMAPLRKQLRSFILRKGLLRTKQAQEADSVYRNYYDFSAPPFKLQHHQVLAINRGEKEAFLKVSLEVNEAEVTRQMEYFIIRGKTAVSDFLRTVIADAWNRLLASSMENELRSELTAEASEGAIHNFALNLRPLLMQPPVKGHVTMGLDPGYRHGCKVAVIDATGKVLDTTVVYPTFNNRKQEAIRTLASLVRRHNVEHLAVGNGTASRETEQVVLELIREMPERKLSYMMVNEAGASVYSASELAAAEFPQFDVNLRSAVSIARRMQDPLAELVKIDPKAIGVGQYQHDMPQKRLGETLNGVVEDCVNAVGVDLNTASPSLLQYVAGLNSTTAKNIVAYREENGMFRTRKQLLKVPKLGPKAFQQCAGFLRIPESDNPLDRTGVHPESYAAAEKLLDICGCSADKASSLADKIKKLDENKIAALCGVGVPTLRDMVAELTRPGRDPRDELPPPVLRSDVLSMEDLKPGMTLTGTVRNVIDFGAFVDIGVHQDGLVHISEICNKFIRHPSEVLTVGDVVQVTVLGVDAKKNRISLTMKPGKK